MQQLYDGTTVSTSYWGSGQPATVTEDPRDGSQIYQTYHEYDTVGLPSLSLSPSGELETRYGYDRAGRMEWLFAPGGQTTHWTRSPLGMVTRRDQTGRPGVTTTLNLAARELVHQDNAAGAVSVARFDEVGRVVYQLDAAGVARDLQWHPDGTLDHVSVLGDSGYTQVTYGHDAGNRLRSITVAAASEIPDTTGWPLAVAFDYDALDNLTLASDDRDVAVSRVVWSTGEVATEALTVGGESFVTEADYDGTFLPETITYPDASTVGLVRADRLGRLSALTVDGDPVWSQLYSGLRRGAGSTGALDMSRTYDFDARPVMSSAAVGGSQRFLLERGYNDAGRFETQRTQAGTEALATLGHDAGLRTSGWRWQRDAMGGVEEALGWAGPATGRVDTTFGPGGVDRIAKRSEFIDGEELVTQFFESAAGPPYQLGGAGPWSFAYDGFGNRAEAASAVEVRRFRHDWSNRLLEVTSTPSSDEPANSLARFVYDPLGRRIAAVEGGVTTYRVPWGDQVVAEYVEGASGEVALRKRLYWGDGIDDLLAYDWDTNFDGVLESRFHPLTDAQGTVQAVAAPDGVVVESYVYRPDGSFMIFGMDTTAPELVLARLRPADEGAGRPTQTLEMVFSEPVQKAGGTAEVRDGGGEAVAAETAPTADARRWVMAFVEPLVEGEGYTFVLEGFEDRAGNVMADTVEEDFVAPAADGALAVATLAEASIVAVIDGPDGLALVAGAAVDPDSVAASSITVSRVGLEALEITGTLSLVDAAADPAWDGRILLWTPNDPSEYTPARYDLTLNLALVDVAGTPLRGPPAGQDYFHHGQGDIVWSKPSEAPLRGLSAVGNDRFLHGRPYIDSLGLYDHRARFYEPGTQLFLEPDPLGPVDSPNLYQAFGFDGLNVVDPYGARIWDWVKKRASEFVDWWSGVDDQAEELVERQIDQALPAAPDPTFDPYGERAAYEELGIDPDQTARSRASLAFGEVRSTTVAGAGTATRVTVEGAKLAAEGKAVEGVLAAGGAAFKATAKIRVGGGSVEVSAEVASGQRRLKGGFGVRAGTASGGFASESSEGFHSFRAFKRTFGSAGENRHWHHVVEQTPRNVSRFGPETIHNTGNLVSLDVTTHRRIGGFYSSIQPQVTGSVEVTVREWLSTQSYEAQRQFGIDLMVQLGVLK